MSGQNGQGLPKLSLNFSYGKESVQIANFLHELDVNKTKKSFLLFPKKKIF